MSGDNPATGADEWALSFAGPTLVRAWLGRHRGGDSAELLADDYGVPVGWVRIALLAETATHEIDEDREPVDAPEGLTARPQPEGEFFVDVPDDAPSYQDRYEWKPLSPPLGDDEVTALIERLRTGAWLMEKSEPIKSAVVTEAADALERLKRERDEARADRNAWVDSAASGLWAAANAHVAKVEAERDALPEKIAQAIVKAWNARLDRHRETHDTYDEGYLDGLEAGERVACSFGTG